MFKSSNTNDKQPNQQPELVPLTPEVAREIEKLLDKHTDTLRNLKANHKTGSDRQKSHYRSDAT